MSVSMSTRRTQSDSKQEKHMLVALGKKDRKLGRLRGGGRGEYDNRGEEDVWEEMRGGG